MTTAAASPTHPRESRPEPEPEAEGGLVGCVTLQTELRSLRAKSVSSPTSRKPLREWIWLTVSGARLGKLAVAGKAGMTGIADEELAAGFLLAINLTMQ